MSLQSDPGNNVARSHREITTLMDPDPKQDGHQEPRSKDSSRKSCEMLLPSSDRYCRIAKNRMAASANNWQHERELAPLN